MGSAIGRCAAGTVVGNTAIVPVVIEQKLAAIIFGLLGKSR